MSKPITQSQVDEFVAECRNDIKENKMETDHCIILYKCKGFHNETKYVHKVYKTVDEFANRGLDDMNDLDFEWGIVPKLWFFD